MAKVYNRKRASAKRAALGNSQPNFAQRWASVNGSGDFPAVVPKVTIAEDLKRIADALPSEPARGRGRPRKDAPVSLSRQQLRYRARMLAKADEAIRKIEGGQS